jgi:hypothetical protein
MKVIYPGPSKATISCLPSLSISLTITLVKTIAAIERSSELKRNNPAELAFLYTWLCVGSPGHNQVWLIVTIKVSKTPRIPHRMQAW